MEIGKTSHMGLINPIDKCKIVSGFGTIKSKFTAIMTLYFQIGLNFLVIVI